jgi:calcium permeable stress-gated cation channel
MINDSYGPLIHSLPLTLADHIGEEPTRASEAPGESEESHDVASGDKKAAIADADPEAQTSGVGKTTNGGEGVAEEEDGDLDMKPREQPDYGFAHPATSRPQRTIWMAKDTLGLSAEEMTAIRERGIDVSCVDADMDAKGDVTIQGPPPDEESRA